VKFEIKNRFSGEVQFVASIECTEDTPISIKLGSAIKWAVENKADLSYADLRSANALAASITRLRIGLLSNLLKSSACRAKP
jgi:hypothetical protein